MEDNQDVSRAGARLFLACLLFTAFLFSRDLHAAEVLTEPGRPHFTIPLKQSSPPGENEVNPRDDITSLLDVLVRERYGNGETASYSREQLNLLWNKFPDYRHSSNDAASRIAALWKEKGEPQPDDDPLRRNEVILLIWRTYHCLVADQHPLDLNPEESARKASQLQRLGRILERLDSEVARQKADLPEGTLAAIREEAQRCIKRLNEHAASPAWPVLYYPLHDDAFEKAINNVESKVQEYVHMFLVEYSVRLGQVHNAPRGAERLRVWSQLQGKGYTALTMGAIVRHYCMIDRDLDYEDRTMFPFWKVNGFGVTYMMHEGLSMRLGIHWEASPSSVSDK